MSELNVLRNRLTQVTSGQIADMETAMDQLAGLYQEAASMIDAFKALQGEIKEEIAAIMTETGQTDITTSTARCYVSSPSVRISYDRKGLDELAIKSAEIAEAIRPFRKETQVAGTLTIRAIKEK